MIIQPAFSNFEYTWPHLAQWLSTEDLKAISMTSSSIRTSLRSGLEQFLLSFFEMQLSEQENVSDLFSMTALKVKFLCPISLLVEGEIYRIRGSSVLAQLIFEKTKFEHYPENTKKRALALTAKAIVCIWNTKRELAQKYLEEACSITPSPYALTKLYQFNAYRLCNPDLAFSALQYVLRKDPSNIHAIARLSEVFFYGIGLKRNPQEGLQQLTYLLKDAKETSLYTLHLHILLAGYNKDLGNFPQAISICTKVLMQKDRLFQTLLLPKVYILLADIQLVSNPEQASSYLRNAALWAKTTVDMYNAATLFEKLRENERAIDLCEKVLKIDPQHLHARKMRGVLLYKAGKDPQMVLEDLKMVHSKWPTDTIVSQHLIDLLLSGRVDEDPQFLGELLSKKVDQIKI